MRLVFTTAAAVVALAAATSFSLAQQPEGKQPPNDKGGARMEQPSSNRPVDRPPQATPQPAPAERRTEPKDGAGKDQRVQPGETDAKQRRTQTRDTEPSTRPAQAPSAKEREAKPNQGSEGRERQSQPKDQPAAKEKQAQPRDNVDPAARQPQSGQKQAPGQADQSTRPGSNSAARVTVTEEQQTRMRQSFRPDASARVSKVNFSIAVGTRVPTSVRYRPLPVVIVNIVPEYRGYSYFIVDDQICIVEPRTREIVTLIDTRGVEQSGMRTALSLTTQERLLIQSGINHKMAPADIRVRLALGAEVPDRVRLYPFPNTVLARVPKVRDYRYVVVDRAVAIIDPRNRNVVLVLED